MQEDDAFVLRLLFLRMVAFCGKSLSADSKSEVKTSTERIADEPYSCAITYICSGDNSATKTLIHYDVNDTLVIEDEFIEDQENRKDESKTSTGRLVNAPQSCTSTHISSDNKSAIKTLIEYDVDETLEIKEEIIQGKETTTGQKLNKTNESKFCTVYIREDDISQALPKRHTCEKCGRTYKTKYHMNYHQKFECGVMPQFSCDFCNQLFKRKSVMNAHVRRIHHKTKSKTLNYKCEKCSRSYNWLGSLTRHKTLVHAVEKPQFICDFCGHKSNRKCNLVKHITSRHSQTFKSRNKCDICSRNYLSLSGLYQHKRIEHAALKPQFNCAICDFKTKRKDYLSNHITAKHSDMS
ncbi:zinc finger protein 257-like [Belonocnema kinseyi]|uniref:zinc finger protein 257-like n=1 Tax=Belonocnema kinseyi TaxID=2817044 RepID=UPI00143CEA89|nr:zinc finger protein 257-like [Belonocnema kinseyi]